MKDLYGRVIPEISKFENRLLDFEIDHEKNCRIIRQYDETIAHKSDKIMLDRMKADCHETFASK